MKYLIIFLFSLPLALQAKSYCSWDGPAPTYIYWQPELANQPDMRPFYFTFDRFYDYQWNEPAYRYKTNTDEWIEYASFRPQAPDVDSLLLKSNVKDLQQLAQNAKTGARPVGKFEDNVFAQYLTQNNQIAALNYLIFAKKCEKYVYMEDEWAENPKMPSEMRKLYQEGQSLYENEKSDFLKYRYAFQCIRLAHYAGDNSQAIGMYDKMLDKSLTKSVVKDWALGHKAGALMAMGKRVDALYLYSTAFEKCPSKRVNMYLSFNPNSDEEWNGIMAKCKNNREKTTLHLLRAIDPNAVGMEEMQKIYELDTKSEYLNLLLVREINKLETNIMGDDFQFQFPIAVDYKPINEDSPSKMSSEYLYKFKTFVQQKVGEGKLKDPQTWNLALAYLYYLTGDFDKAKYINQDYVLNSNDPKLKKQAQVFDFLLAVNDLKTINPTTEDKIFQKYLDLQVEQKANYTEDWEYQFANKPIYDCLRYKLIYLYKVNKQAGKAFLLQSGIEGFYKKNAEISLIDEILTMTQNPQTTYERYLSEQVLGKDHLLDIKGTTLLRIGAIQAAHDIFASISPEYKNNENLDFTLHANPFEDNIKDCHECAEEKYATNKQMNKLWLTSELLKYEKEAKNPETTAAANYKLALAWYNMTYFAPAWRALMFSRGSTDIQYITQKPDEYTNQAYIDEMKEGVFFDMKPSIKYIQAARAANPDNELSAKLNFLLAKCKQNEMYVGLEENNSKVTGIYELLRKQYADTKFYKQAIKECKYFSDFVKK